MTDTMLIMFACNHYDNGSDLGKADAFEFGDLLHIAGGWIVVRRIGVDKLRIGRRVFPIISYGSWIGNWCWDGARVTLEVANRIAAHLQATGRFNAEHGEATIFDMWHEGKSIDFRQVQP